MNLFSLQINDWVAMDRIPFDRSPVRILDVKPLKTGEGVLRVSFFHAWYPGGVQEKEMDLRVVARNESLLAGIDDMGSLVVFQKLTQEWFHPMNVEPDSELAQSQDPVAWLERHLFRPP